MALTADHVEDPGLVLSLIMFSDGPFEGGNGFPAPLTQSHHTEASPKPFTSFKESSACLLLERMAER